MRIKVNPFLCGDATIYVNLKKRVRKVHCRKSRDFLDNCKCEKNGHQALSIHHIQREREEQKQCISHALIQTLNTLCLRIMDKKPPS